MAPGVVQSLVEWQGRDLRRMKYTASSRQRRQNNGP